jgi:DNA polymerase-1
MENLLANTDKLKGKMKRIMTNKEKILSKTLRLSCSTAVVLTKRIMNYLLQMSKNRCSFNELEFRRMAEQFDSIFKREGTQQQSKSNDDDDSSKSPNKSEDQFDLLEVDFR